MKVLESWLLSYLLNSLWQLPLLFAAGWLAARALRSAGDVAEHRVWVCVLLLQSILPATSALPRGWLPALFTWISNTRHTGEAHVSVVMGAGTGLGTLPLPGGVLAAIAIAYAAAIAYFAARFIWRWKNLSGLRREAVSLPLAGEARLCWAQCCARFGIDNASIAISSRIFGPLTIGFFRRLVLLPARFSAQIPGDISAGLPPGDLYAAIAHELAHLRRNDFLKNLVYELFSLPVSYHPMLWLTRERIMETREMICDRMAAEVSGRNEYARSLLRLASVMVNGVPARIPHTIGIFDANAFERRVMKLAKKQDEIRGARRFAVVLACVVFGLATGASAIALSMHIDAPSTAATDTASHHGPLNVSADAMAGNRISGSNPKYPAAAKKAGIEGTVVLSAMIGKDGLVEELTVVSGPKELQQPSLDAVRDWIYKPFLLNGDPIEVKTTINVIYSLARK